MNRATGKILPGPASPRGPACSLLGAFPSVRTLPALFAISFVIIAWQLGLMRSLLIARYHHFSFLVISCALLGFGAGGTLLSLCRDRFIRNASTAYQWGLLLFAMSLPVCFSLGELLPLQVFFPPVHFMPTLAWWVLFWMIQTVPFLLGGTLIGLALMTARERPHGTYAVNLMGSAAGALGGIWMLDLLPANGMALPLSLLLVLSGTLLIDHRKPREGRAYAVALVLLGLLFLTGEYFPAGRLFPLNIDQYKPLAYVKRLEAQGDAQRTAVYHGARGRIEVFSGHSFHSLLSLGGTSVPPPMDMVLRDGFHAGSIPLIAGVDEARFLKDTLTALPYQLMQPRNVLILGEAGSMYLWLARLSNAKSIVFVQPDANIVRILQSHPSRVCADPRIRMINAEPRAFLDRTSETFDIIHMAALEGFAAGSGGIGGLRENYLGTVEGFSRCLAVLTKHGIACVSRGIQDPPRDNVKIAATWIEALQKRGEIRPGDHLLIARDELSVATFVSPSPFGSSEVQAFRQACHALSWDTDWFPGVRPEETNRIHALAGPAGSGVSWYYHAVKTLLSGEKERLYREWVANVRPATDNMPFFYDYFRWASLARLRQAFGPLWPTRAEMGFLVLVICLMWTAAVAFMLLPPAWVMLRRAEQPPPRLLLLVTVAYFAGLGSGFMFVEMTLLQLFTRFLGDPVVAAALVFGTLLLFAGMGTLMQPRITARFSSGVLVVCSIIAVLAMAATWGLPALFGKAAGLSSAGKTVIGLILMAPAGLLMGIPFPWGLARLAERSEAAVPLAWSVNGFASVVSTSAAVVLAMVYGFDVLLALAALIYAGAGILGPGILLFTANRHSQRGPCNNSLTE